MCGICGVVRHDGCREEEHRAVSAMNEALVHRGPDDEGCVKTPWAILAARRLSIIDLEGGHQPMANEDSTCWAVYNGETYNHAELRQELEGKGHRFQTRCDTEVVVHLYEELGEKCVEAMNGMFAFAIWDEREKKLLLARDRLGIKPLLYTLSGRTLAFASELQALMRSGLVEPTISPEALDEYLTFLYIGSPRSILSSVRKLSPGHILIFDRHGMRTKRYWDPVTHRRKVEDLRETTEELRRLLSDSVRKRLVADVEVGFFLSGGIDSSTVVAFAENSPDHSLSTFSLGFDAKSYDELDYARAVAERFEMRHRELRLDAGLRELIEEVLSKTDEPLGDSSALPVYVISKLARKEAKVVLTGDGGDELFGGYVWTLISYLAERVRRMPAPVRAGVKAAIMAAGAAGRGRRLSRRIGRFGELLAVPLEEDFISRSTCFSPEQREKLYCEEARNQLGGFRAEELARNTFRELEELPPLERLLCWDLVRYLPDDILTKVDRMTMANSLEARVPLLDHRVAELALGMPFAWKVHGLTTKRILKRTVSGVLPRKVLRQRKQGFSVPIHHWFRSGLQELARERLLRQNSFVTHLMSRAEVEKLIEQHLSGRGDYGHHLWALMVLNEWAERSL